MNELRRKSSMPLEVVNNGEDLVQYFYKCMLTFIVDKWEDDVKHPSAYIPKPKKTFITPKSYTQACNEYELETDAIPNMEGDENLLKSGSKIKGTKTHKKNKKYDKSRSRKFSNFSGKSVLFDEYVEPDLEQRVMIKFTNGNVYNGPVYKKKFHGRGRYRWANGSTYIGDFVNGEITGKGKFYYNDQSSYEGEVYKGFAHGYGKRLAPESPSVYCGYWNIGKREGAGWVKFTEDNWYEGTWQTDKMHGNGVRCYSNGSKYQGAFHEGKRHGTGCAIMWNNDVYIGEWVDGKRSGHGEYVWNAFLASTYSIPVQNKYTGNWMKDHMHGKGELNLGTKNGTRYIGEFFENYKHGGGLIVCDNGDIIECEKIFANDKPIHLQDSEEFADPSHVSETCLEHCGHEFDRIEKGPNSEDSIYLQTENLKPSEKNKKVFLLPPSERINEKLATFNLCQFKFEKHIPRRSSIRMPINVTGESINLDPLIRNLCELIYDCHIGLASDSYIKIPNTWEKVGCQAMTEPHFKYDYQEMYNIEEKALRRAIHINLRRLRDIYKHYSLVGCLKKVPYDTLMNRLFLWQFYRDCKISEKGISISLIDTLLAEDSICFSESIHDPFENIYFWQFLTTLVKTSWEIYGSKSIKYVFDGRSILEQVFTKFLNEDIFPHVGHHLGCVLFDYKNIVPLQAAYNWYKSIQEPMTIRTFVLNIFSLDKKETFQYEPIPKEFFVKTGRNVSIGSNILYLTEQEPKYGITPKEETVVPFKGKCLKKKLYFLRELGRNSLYNRIRSVVPGIFIKRECCNHDYQLCFLEFYEIVLVCTQQILKVQELRLKKKNAKISGVNQNVVIKVAPTKKSKQYSNRKSGVSHHSIYKRHAAT